MGNPGLFPVFLITKQMVGFEKGVILGLFFILFSVSNNFLQNINIKHDPSGISNSQSLDHQSPPITTRPGLEP